MVLAKAKKTVSSVQSITANNRSVDLPLFITLSSLSWFGRDIWFQRWDIQSLGRYLFDIRAMSTNGMEQETWNCMKLNSVVPIVLSLWRLVPIIVTFALNRSGGMQSHMIKGPTFW